MEIYDVKGVIYEITAPELKGTLVRGLYRSGKNSDGLINCEALNLTPDNAYIFNGGSYPFYPKELSITILTPLEKAIYT